MNQERAEKLAKTIAFYHGAQIVLRRDGETLTVAALAGYGSWGHSPERYAEAKWRQYLQAAEAAYAELVPESEETEVVAA